MAIKLPKLRSFSLKNFLLCITFLASISSFSQSTNKRISITNPTENVLKQVHESGIDLKCGVQFDENNNIILELTPEELLRLESKQVPYKVLIEDLSRFYKARSEEFLPIAKMELEESKQRSKGNKGKFSKSLSFNSVTVDNIIQYDGCEEIDWTANVPQNFELGSMAGCLTYSEMLAQLDLMRLLYPSLISVKTDALPGTVTHGNSYNAQGQDTWAGQPIYYVKISDNPNVDELEPEALYTGMAHSREVSSMMNLMYFMWYILENYDSDTGIKNFVDNRELYFIPVVNPDGLMWNEQQEPTGGGLQRKNLNPAANTGDNVLRGIDLNRNYNYFWGSSYAGSSNNPASNTYRGASGFSEPETQIIKGLVEARDFKTAMLHHASANNLLHGYSGDPFATPSGREDEFAKFCHDMSRYNRYIYGTVPDILTVGNGGTIDWMLGGPADNNGETGSGKEILAITPENGSWQDPNEGFWPTATKITEIAQRALRMNFVSGYIAGKFAQLHDFTSTDINLLTGDLDFAIEFIGQTTGNFTLNVTPVSTNIVSIVSPTTETGMMKLEQRQVTATYTLNASIQANDLIEYQVTLSNEDHIIYQANVVKYYQPTILFQDNPDVDGISNWTTSNWTTTSDGYQGTTGLTHATGSYGNNQTRTITLGQSFNFSTSEVAIVQFNAKWALERNFDYVQLEARVNGGAWNELCGKYTKPGSDYGGNRYSSGNSSNGSAGKTIADQNNQPSGEMVYEGHGMDKWVMEEIYINATNNSQIYNQNNVEFRFVFDSDSNNRADGYGENFDPFDGFTFDDFKVIGIEVPCDATNPPTNIVVSGNTTTTANVTWSAIPSTMFDLRYRVVGSPTWIDVLGLTSNSYDFTSLTLSTSYEVQVRSNCGATMSAYTDSEFFTTLALDYCAAAGTGQYDTGVTQVLFNDLSNSHINNRENNGYQDFLAISTTVTQGSSHILSVNVDRDGGTGYAFAWIDFNIDGDFDDPGEEFDLGTATTGDNTQTSTTPSITFPTGVGYPLGPTRLRVATRYNTDPTGPCATGYDGEVEDYTINIDAVLDVNNEVELADFQIYPNPFDNNLKIRLPLSLTYNKVKVSIIDLQGRVLKEKILTNNTQEINLDNLKGFSNSVYFISIETDGNVKVIKKLIKI